MKRQKFGDRELLIAMGFSFVAVCFLLPWFPIMFANDRYRGHYSCTSNLKRIAQAMFQYSQDYDDRLPLVRVNDTNITPQSPLGWVDALSPYLTVHRRFWCDMQIANRGRNTSKRLPTNPDYTDYYFNRRLSGMSKRKIENANHTLLLGEGNDGTDTANARYSLEQVPAAWREEKKSPLFRHCDGTNYAFTDGHVKWLKPDKITELKAIELKSKPGHFTFAIK